MGLIFFQLHAFNRGLISFVALFAMVKVHADLVVCGSVEFVKMKGHQLIQTIMSDLLLLHDILLENWRLQTPLD